MRRAPILDGRLSTAMELAKGSRIFADIGADHGRLSTVMLLEDPQRIGLVADISPLALDKARARIERMGLNERAHLRVADGLEALRDFPYHPDTVFILGMGGDTVSQILLRGSALLHEAALILGAQTEIPLHTAWHELSLVGFHLVETPRISHHYSTQFCHRPYRTYYTVMISLFFAASNSSTFFTILS